MSPSTDAEIYENLMRGLNLGHGVYEPEPNGYDHVRVGDVGYIDGGSFVRLYNACYGKDDKANENSYVPNSHSPIPQRFREVREGPLLDSGIRTSRAVKHFSASGGVPSSDNAPLSSVGGESSSMITRQNSCGAMLYIADDALRFDATHKEAYKKYILAHSEALERLVYEQELGIDLSDIIIITECCLTSKGEILVTRASSGSANFNFDLHTGGLETTIHGTESSVWSSQTQVPVHKWGPPSDISGVGQPEALDDEVYHDVQGSGDTPDRTQCIFFRGYRVERRGVPLIEETRVGERSEEFIILDESFNDPDDRVSPIKSIFDFIFQRSDADLAVLHDDDICRIAAGNGNDLDDDEAYLEAHATEYEVETRSVHEGIDTTSVLEIVNLEPGTTADQVTAMFSDQSNITHVSTPIINNIGTMDARVTFSSPHRAALAREDFSSQSTRSNLPSVLLRRPGIFYASLKGVDSVID